MGLSLSEPYDPGQGVGHEPVGLHFTNSGMRPVPMGIKA